MALSLATMIVSATGSNGGAVTPATSTCTLVQEHCTVTFTAQSAGSLILSASYPGDDSNLGGSGSSSLTVQNPPQSTSSTTQGLSILLTAAIIIAGVTVAVAVLAVFITIRRKN